MDIFEHFFANCGDAIVIVNHQAEIVYANGEARSRLGSTLDVLTNSGELPTFELWEMQQGQLVQCSGTVLTTALSTSALHRHEFLLRYAPISESLWLVITSHSFHLPSCNFQGILLIVHNFSRYQASIEELKQPDQRDDLTGLVNRTIFMDRIQHALVKAQKDDNVFVAILCVDVIRLKAVNDTLGYLAGDRLLVEVARRLNQCLRPEDTLSRLGGDEFTILLEGVTSYSQVMAIAETLHEQMAQPFKLEGHEINIGISIGISLGNHKIPNADTLLRQADLAMTQSKTRYGERYCLFEADMAPNTCNSLHLEMSLKNAIEAGELYLEYQPIFLVRTQAVIGVESLVRWQHPTQGSLAPGQFIPIAEKTGLVIPLGWWVLEESCRQLKEWQDTIHSAQALFVSVNMSSQQFAQKDVLERIKAILQKTGLSPHFLKIEITESVLINNAESIIEILTAIRALGIRLSVDDFGTGYSSLSYLHQFPVDTLKIDRSFLENADSDFEKLEILQSVVRLAWNLGLEVVAEGIETPKHLARVQALRCESGQGFLFSRPLKTQEIETILRSQTA